MGAESTFLLQVERKDDFTSWMSTLKESLHSCRPQNNTTTVGLTPRGPGGGLMGMAAALQGGAVTQTSSPGSRLRSRKATPKAGGAHSSRNLAATFAAKQGYMKKRSKMQNNPIPTWRLRYFYLYADKMVYCENRRQGPGEEKGEFTVVSLGGDECGS